MALPSALYHHISPVLSVLERARVHRQRVVRDILGIDGIVVLLWTLHKAGFFVAAVGTRAWHHAQKKNKTDRISYFATAKAATTSWWPSSVPHDNEIFGATQSCGVIITIDHTIMRHEKESEIVDGSHSNHSLLDEWLMGKFIECAVWRVQIWNSVDEHEIIEQYYMLILSNGSQWTEHFSHAINFERWTTCDKWHFISLHKLI